MKLNINPTSVQRTNAEQLDQFAHVFCGIKLNNADSGTPLVNVDKLYTDRINALSADYTYNGVKEALADLDITLNAPVTYYRIGDPDIKAKLLSVIPHADASNITEEEMHNVASSIMQRNAGYKMPSNDVYFQDNDNVVYFDYLNDTAIKNAASFQSMYVYPELSTSYLNSSSGGSRILINNFSKLKYVDLSNIIIMGAGSGVGNCPEVETVDFSSISEVSPWYNSTLYNCPSLKKITTDSLRVFQMGGSYDFVQNCGIKFLNLPSLVYSSVSITSTCNRLKTVDIGENHVGHYYKSDRFYTSSNLGRSIYNKRMFNDTKVENIILRQLEVFDQWGINCFDCSNDFSSENKRFFVPSSMVDKYKASSYWDPYKDIVYPIGGTEWQQTMWSLAEEEGVEFLDYSLTHIDKAIYDYLEYTDELTGFELQIPSEYQSSGTYVFDEVYAKIKYYPDNTSKEHCTLTCDDGEIIISDTDQNDVKLIQIPSSTDVNNMRYVTFTITSTQDPSIGSTTSVQLAYPVVTSITATFDPDTQYITCEYTGNTDNKKLLSTTYTTTGDIGISNTGWVYSNDSAVQCTGTITLSNQFCSTPGSLQVTLAVGAEERQVFEDPNVEKLLCAFNSYAKGNVIPKSLFTNATQLCESNFENTLFRNNTHVTSFNEFKDTIITKLPTSYFAYSSLQYIQIPETMTFITSDFFFNSGLKYIDFPTGIQFNSSVCAYCKYLTEARIQFSTPVNDDWYNSRAIFNSCGNLEKVTIKAGSVCIPYSTFYSCVKLTTLILEDSTPLTIYPNAFDNVKNIQNIYVPADAVEAYKIAEGWSAYVDKIQANPE